MIKQTRIFFLTGVVAFWLPSCARAESDLDTLASWLGGCFSSQEQAEADSSFLDIRLEMVRIWPDHPDGYWFYVEQATATHQDRPYRQRVYHVTAQPDGRLRSEVYSIPNPQRFAGDWRSGQPLATLTSDSLEHRAGCAVILSREQDGTFKGGTVGSGCVSGLRGASYATSEVVVTPDALISWDRGFDADDRQVWGATAGGYVFKRINGGQQPGEPPRAANERRQE